MENACKNLDNSKYCHNYITTTNLKYEKYEESMSEKNILLNIKQFLPRNYALDFNSTQNLLFKLEELTKENHQLSVDLKFQNLPKISEIYFQNNVYVRKLKSFLSKILLKENQQEDNIVVIQVIILLYLQVLRSLVKSKEICFYL